MSGPSPDRLGRADPPPAAAAAAASNLVGLVRLIAIAAISIGLLEAGAGIAYREPRAVLLGWTAAIYGVWVVIRAGGLDTSDRERTITTDRLLDPRADRPGRDPPAVDGDGDGDRLAPAGGHRDAARLEPDRPSPPRDERSRRRLERLRGRRAPGLEPAAAELQSAFAFFTLVLAYTFLILFLWEVSRRLKDTAADLRSVIAMSGDLAQSLDPRLVGDRIAVHIARAVGADDCALSYWDRPTNRVITLGYEPPERRGALNETYAVDDFPATRAVLETQRPALIDVDDATADAAEVRYLAYDRAPLDGDGPARGGRTDDRPDRGDRRPATGVRRPDGRARDDARRRGGDGPRERPPLRRDPPPGAPRRADRPRQPGPVPRPGRARRRAQPAVRRRQLAMLFIDLDDFKVLNDTHGHARGDEVLGAVGERVRGVLRPVDTAARLGGDEFAVLLEDVVDEADALAVATPDRRVAAAAARRSTSRRSASRRASAWRSGQPARRRADDLLRNADVAMYAAKRSSRGGAEIFRPGLRDGAAERAARAERAPRRRGARRAAPRLPADRRARDGLDRRASRRSSAGSRPTRRS